MQLVCFVQFIQMLFNVNLDKKFNDKDLKETPLQPLLRSSCKLAAQVMTSDASYIENDKIHIIQHLNELRKIDQLYKKISNDENDKPIWLSQRDNLNLLCSLPSDVRRNGNVRNNNVPFICCMTDFFFHQMPKIPTLIL